MFIIKKSYSLYIICLHKLLRTFLVVFLTFKQWEYSYSTNKLISCIHSSDGCELERIWYASFLCLYLLCNCLICNIVHQQTPLLIRLGKSCMVLLGLHSLEIAKGYHLYSVFGISVGVLRKSGVIMSLWKEPWAVLPQDVVGRNGCCWQWDIWIYLVKK